MIDPLTGQIGMDSLGAGAGGLRQDLDLLLNEDGSEVLNEDGTNNVTEN